MTSEELISKIRELRQIKPRKDWVLLTKSQILGKDKPVFNPFFIFKPVFAGVLFVFILFGLLGNSQNSLPGDLLYPIKKITEKAQVVFVSKEELPKYNLEIANKRLDELNEIAQTNQVKKLAPAISEFQANMSEAAKSLAEVKRGADVEKIIAQIKKLEENKQIVEGVLATKIETEDYDTAFAQFVENQIKDLEKSTLTETQEEVLKEAKEYFEKGDFETALIKAVEASQVK